MALIQLAMKNEMANPILLENSPRRNIPLTKTANHTPLVNRTYLLFYLPNKLETLIFCIVCGIIARLIITIKSLE